MSALLPCPFCGGAAMHIQQNYVIGCQPCGVWMADYRKDEWNRRTQPEATNPAQDLSAAIDWLRNNYQDHTNIASLCDAMCAALASSSDALVAGDSTKPDADAYAKDARLALEMPAPEGTHQWLTKSSTPYPVMCSIDELNFHLKKAEHELMMWKHDTPNGQGWMVDWWRTKVDFYKEAINAAIQAQKDGHSSNA